jgi:uncharacterized protein (TIGR02246 family)
MLYRRLEEGMQNRYSVPAAVAIGLIVAGCSQAPPPAPDTREADAKAIRDVETAWSQSFATKDVDKFGAFWADDASVFMTDSPVLNGIAAIKAAWKPIVADKKFSVTFAPTKVEVSKASDLGYSQGAYTMTITAAKTKKVLTERGKYVTVYKKQADGGWKAVADIFNADASAAPRPTVAGERGIGRRKRLPK